MSIKYISKGNFQSTKNFLVKAKRSIKDGKLITFAEMGLEALKEATPVDTGLSASSWSYKIIETSYGHKIEWHNDNISEKVPVVILIEYGHVNQNGSFIPPNEFIEKAMKPVFEKIEKSTWGEVLKG